MLAAPIVRMGRTEDVGMRIGMCFTIMAISAVAGPPISGAINAATGGFKFTGIYAGTHCGTLVVCPSTLTYDRDAHRSCRHARCRLLDAYTTFSPRRNVGQVLGLCHVPYDSHAHFAWRTHYVQPPIYISTRRQEANFMHYLVDLTSYHGLHDVSSYALFY